MEKKSREWYIIKQKRFTAACIFGGGVFRKDEERKVYYS